MTCPSANAARPVSASSGEDDSRAHASHGRARPQIAASDSNANAARRPTGSIDAEHSAASGLMTLALASMMSASVRRFLQVLILQSLVAIALTFTAAIFLVAGLGTRKLRRLADISDRPIDNPPFLSVVIAARQEAEHLPATLTALLAQSYPAFEVVLVNDRSTDATGSIAEEMARADARLQVVHVTSLPGGWLGKTHAMHTGAARARGEFLLFTDGDVVFAPGTLARAMRLVVQEKVDHLAVVPCITSPSRILRLSVGAVALKYKLFTRAW